MSSRALALAWLLGARGAAAAPAADPVAAFVRHDQILDARIAPGGRTLALVLLEGGRRTLGLVDLGTRKQKSVVMDGDNSVGAVHWASDARLVLELVHDAGYLAAPVHLGELYGLGADGGNGRLVFGYRAGEMQTGTNIRKAQADRAWAEVVGRIPGGDEVLIQSTAWAEVGDRVVTVYRLDAVTGLKQEVTVAPIKNAGVIADENGEPRIAWARDAQVVSHFYYREAKGSWAELARLQGATARSLPVGFCARDRTLYVEEGDDAGFAVYAIDVDTGARRELARNAFADPSQLVFDAAHRLVAVEFEPDLPSYTFVAPEHPIARALRGLAGAYPDAQVRFVDASADDRKVVVLVYSDRDPGRYLVVDTQTMSAQLVGQVRPWVKPDDAAERSAFHIKASDGLRIHGYVTLPPAGDSPPPMVVLPHGGPHWVRDHWRYDAEAQLLAAQGFAVLQVNFRGSEGYGRAYLEAGFGHWGDRMIADLLDATRFAVRKGWADPDRICTYGASYGGYAALQAAILAPDLFRCAAGYAGVYDLERIARSEAWVESRTARGYFGTAAGADPEALRAISPVNEAARLTVPVFLAHGEEDPRAPIEGAERLKKALTALGRPPEWLVEPHEGHGFYDEGARARLYTRLLAFLRANTAPRPGPAKPGGAP
jgi:dipeptidyl aminopeptidase/acylaminoacyl peptidase